ncbi:homoserine kinase [Arcanobacterium canis]|uniref:Homoserine kinase n=1 Tax=Arcanobacterium canis TaxID=999183 RepID=A0ABY8FX03_9ACTO|nr:homoserine kinase [Arcanobacterium canis]WFM83049.1 homoserine kinase [Arcanobacterium canis]
MRLTSDYARVRVPGVITGFGPGLDAIGIAVDVWDEVSVTLTTGATRVTILGEGNRTLPRDHSHMVARALSLALESAGAPVAGFDLVCRNSIPRGVGLGDEAAEAIAGIALARELLEDPSALTDDIMLRLAADLVGSPSAVAAAIRGGATLAWVESSAVKLRDLQIVDQLPIVLMVPPSEGPVRADVGGVDSPLRAAMFVYALANEPALIAEATRGVNAKGVTTGESLLRALRNAGWPAVYTGGGPALVVFAKVAPAMGMSLAESGIKLIRTSVAPGVHPVSGK